MGRCVMSERDELRGRLNTVVLVTAEARCADDGDGYTDVWVTNIEATVDAVLAEIERTHVLVERGAARRIAVAAGVSECDELNGAPCMHPEDREVLIAMLEGAVS